MPAAVGRIGVTLRRKWMTMFKIHTVGRERRGAACRGCLLQLSHFTPPRLQLSEVNDGVANPSSTWRIALLVLSLMNCFLLFYVCCTYSTPMPLCLFLSLCHSPSYHNSCLGLPKRVVVQHAILHGSRRLFFSNFPCILIGKRVFAISANCFDVLPVWTGFKKRKLAIPLLVLLEKGLTASILGGYCTFSRLEREIH